MGTALGTRLGTKVGTLLGADLSPRDVFTGTPDTIIAAGDLKTRYRADQGITLNGSRVSGWARMGTNGGNFSQATASNQPLYSATTLNGRAGVTADDSQRFMGTGIMLSPIAAGSRGYVWCYCRVNTLPTAIRYVCSVSRGNSTPRMPVLINASGNWSRNLHNGAASLTGDTGLAADLSRHLIEVGFTEAGTDAYVVSGKNRGGTALAVTTDVIGHVYFASLGGVVNTGALCTVGEIVVMAGEPTAQQKIDMRRYFQTYYGTI